MAEVIEAEYEVISEDNESKDANPELIIIAPHPDDEIIGAYKYLTKPGVRPIVIYSGDLDGARKESALKLKEHVNCKLQLFQMTVPQPFLHKANTYLFPDPIYELHPSMIYLQ